MVENIIKNERINITKYLSIRIIIHKIRFQDIKTNKLHLFNIKRQTSKFYSNFLTNKQLELKTTNFIKRETLKPIKTILHKFRLFFIFFKFNKFKQFNSNIPFIIQLQKIDIIIYVILFNKTN